MGSHTLKVTIVTILKILRMLLRVLNSLLLISLAGARPRVQEYPVECPESTDGFPVFLPHESNCTLYYECQGDWPILMECAPPLYFDPTIDICNYPSEVDCVMPTSEAPITTEEPAFNTTSIAPITTEEPAFNTTSEAPITTEEPAFITTSEAPITTEEPAVNATSVAPITTEKPKFNTTAEVPITS